MGAHGEKPVKKPGVKTRASKKKRIDRVKARDERARRRYGVVQFALRWLSKNEDESLNQAYVTALEAFKTGTLKWEPPARNTFYNWVNIAKAEGEAAGLHAFRDKPRSGRPVKAWDDLVLDQADRLIRAGVQREATPLHRELCDFAERRNLPSPTLWQVRALLEGYDLAVLSAAAHGRRSAASDALPHPTIPVDFTHQVWTLDESQVPVWIRAFHPLERVWVSIRLWIIVIADNASRAILSAYAVEPFKRGRTTYSYDGDDIKAAFLSAALPDLATPGSEPFSGYLPETLRWDRSRTHAPLASMIGDDALQIPMLPGLKPYSRGSIERVIGTMKDFFEGADGHADLWTPEDQEKGDERRRRSKAAATLHRRRRRITRPVAELPTFQDFAQDLGDRVRRYNTVHVNRTIGVPPEVEYHRLFSRDHARRGVDVLELIEPTVLTVGKGGIDWRSHRFAAYIGARRLGVGERVVCRPDPVGRGLFVEYDGRTSMLLRVEEWSRLHSAEQVARAQAEEVAEISEEADEVLRTIQDEQIKARAKRNARKKAGQTKPVAEPKSIPEPDEAVEIAMEGGDELDVAVGAEKEGGRAESVSPQEKKQLPRGIVRSRHDHLKLVK